MYSRDKSDSEDWDKTMSKNPRSKIHCNDPSFGYTRILGNFFLLPTHPPPPPPCCCSSSFLRFLRLSLINVTRFWLANLCHIKILFSFLNPFFSKAYFILADFGLVAVPMSGRGMFQLSGNKPFFTELK